MDKINDSSDLTTAELKRRNLRDVLSELHERTSSYLMFSLQWKDLDNHYQCLQGALEKREKEVRDLEESVQRSVGDLKARSCELETKRSELGFLDESMKVMCRNLELKECEFGEKMRLAVEAKAREVEEKLKIFEDGKREIVEMLREIEEREGHVEREFEERDGELEEKEKKLKDLDEFVQCRLRYLNTRCQDVELRRSELVALDESMKVVWKNMELRECEFSEKMNSVLEAKGREVEEKVKVFEVVRSEIVERLDKIEERERHVERVFEVKERQLKEAEKKLQELKMEIDVRERAIKHKEKEFEVRCQERLEEVERKHCMVINGKSLQIFLNEHWKEPEKLRDLVSALLRLSMDPALLVLDAMAGFYPPHLTHGDRSFEVGIVRSSCLLLLELLIESGPNINPHVKAKAMKLSSDWVAKMTVDSEHSVEIVALLELLSAYGLADAYDAEKLVYYAENVAHYEQIPRCCRALGLNEKIPDLIGNLLKRKQQLVALEFINEFDLTSEFPPNSIIKDFMKLSRCGTKEVVMEGDHSIEAQNLVISKRVADSSGLAESIAYNHIRTGSVPANIEQLIDSLKQKVGGDKSAYDHIRTGSVPASIEQSMDSLKQKVGRDKSASSVDIRDQIPETSNYNDKDPTLVNIATLVSVDASASPDRGGCTNVTTLTAVPPGIPSQRQIERPCPQTCGWVDSLPNSSIAASMLNYRLEKYHQQADSNSHKGCLPPHLSACGDIERLRALLAEDVNNQLVQGRILSILNSSRDPAYLVSATIKNANSSNLDKDRGVMGIPVKGCILLLELLNNLSPVIEPHVHQEAGQFAKTWRSKLKLKKDDHMGLICFMLFLMVYDLCAAFRPEKILGFLDPACWRKQVPELCQSLGLKDIFPESFVRKIIANKEWIKAIAYIHAFGMEDRFPLASLLKEYLLHSKKKVDNLREGGINSPEVQVEVLKVKLEATRQAARCIMYYNLHSVFPLNAFEKEIEHLERQQEKVRLQLHGDNRKPGVNGESKRKREQRDGDDEQPVIDIASDSSSSGASFPGKESASPSATSNAPGRNFKHWKR